MGFGISNCCGLSELVQSLSCSIWGEVWNIFRNIKWLYWDYNWFNFILDSWIWCWYIWWSYITCKIIIVLNIICLGFGFLCFWLRWVLSVWSHLIYPLIYWWIWINRSGSSIILFAKFQQLFIYFNWYLFKLVWQLLSFFIYNFLSFERSCFIIFFFFFRSSINLLIGRHTGSIGPILKWFLICFTSTC